MSSACALQLALKKYLSNQTLQYKLQARSAKTNLYMYWNSYHEELCNEAMQLV